MAVKIVSWVVCGLNAMFAVLMLITGEYIKSVVNAAVAIALLAVLLRD